MVYIKAHIFNQLAKPILRPHSTPALKGGGAEGVLPRACCAPVTVAGADYTGKTWMQIHIIYRGRKRRQSVLMLLLLLLSFLLFSNIIIVSITIVVFALSVAAVCFWCRCCCYRCCFSCCCFKLFIGIPHSPLTFLISIPHFLKLKLLIGQKANQNLIIQHVWNNYLVLPVQSPFLSLNHNEQICTPLTACIPFLGRVKSCN